MTDPLSRDRRVRIAACFLAISYGLAAPICIVLELRSATFSERFEIPPLLLYGAGVMQFVCAFGVLSRRTAPWAAAVLTVTTVGAVAAHLRIGSPQTAIAAVVYTVVQVWFGWVSRARRDEPGSL